jgi:hypothetical protein
VRLALTDLVGSLSLVADLAHGVPQEPPATGRRASITPMVPAA